MKTVVLKIKLNTVDEVKRFVRITGAIPYKAEVTHDVYVVDAKSIMGIFSLNLAEVLTLVIHDVRVEDEDSLKDKFTAYETLDV